MGIAVLPSQDCLKGRFPPKTLITSSPPKQGRNPNTIRSGRRKRSSSAIRKSGEDRCTTSVVKFPAKNLVIGQVTILKRGEELKTPTKDLRSEKFDEEKKKEEIQDEDQVVYSPDRSDPEPDMVSKQICLIDLRSVDEVFFAGSPFMASPPPSSVPLPAFFTKKDVSKPRNNDAATKDLCRLLHLDLA